MSRTITVSFMRSFQFGSGHLYRHEQVAELVFTLTPHESWFAWIVHFQNQRVGAHGFDSVQQVGRVESDRQVVAFEAPFDAFLAPARFLE